MKIFWCGCLGFVGLAITILAISLSAPAQKMIKSGSQTSQQSLLRGSRVHRQTVWDGAAASLAFEKIPTGAKRENVLRQLAGQWARKNPANAESWADSLKLDSERELALNHIAVLWAKSSPLKALELAQRHHLSQGIVDTILGEWSKEDLDAATKWANDLPSATAQESALLQIFTAHAEIDPASTALLVTENLPPGPTQLEAVMTVLYHWLRLDEAAAVEWVNDFPKGPFRERAEAEIEGFRLYSSAISPPTQEQSSSQQIPKS